MRLTARFQSIQKIHRRARRKDISAYLISLLDSSLLMDIDPVLKHAIHDDTLVKRVNRRPLRWDLLEHMEDASGRKSKDNNQSSVIFHPNQRR